MTKSQHLSDIKKKKSQLDKKRLARDQALILKKKSELLAHSALPSTVNPQSKKIELLSPLSSAVDEKSLYRQIVEKYEENQEFGFFSRSQNFLLRFPKSSLADEVLYLTGMMHFNQQRFGKAIKDFDLIGKRYPRSNRAVSAKFAKGVTYRRMNLDSQAKAVLTELAKKYPGSPEAFRAQIELKTMR